MRTITGTTGADILVGDDQGDLIIGNGGGDTITGGAGADVIWAEDQDGHTIDRTHVSVIHGGDGFDVIHAGYGPNLVYGDGGNDTIDSHGDNAQIYGGDGEDSLSTDGSGALVDGGAGDDFINVSLTSNTYAAHFKVFGGDGNDTITTGAGFGEIHGGAGDDTINVNIGFFASGDNVIFGDDGHDVINSAGGNDEIHGGSGDDWITDTGGNNTVYGDDGNDVLRVLAGKNYVDGGAGDDRIAAYSPGIAQTLHGGEGNDTIAVDSVAGNLLDGGTGLDFADYANAFVGIGSGAALPALVIDLVSQTVSDGVHTDTLVSIEGASGGTGNDLLIGDAGNNELIGGFGNDVLDGGLGDDVLIGGSTFEQPFQPVQDVVIAGDDTVTYASAPGGVSADLQATWASGADGHDRLYGFRGLIGSAFNDVLIGTNDAFLGDNLDGGAGDDVLIGGRNGDLLTGGAGADIFRYLSVQDSQASSSSPFFPTSPDLITDFQTGIDKIDVSALQPTSVAIVQANGVYDVVVTTPGGLLTISSNNPVALADVLTMAIGQTITSGQGGDVLIGTGAADTFVYHSAAEAPGSQPDVLADFQPGLDKIDLSAVHPGAVTIDIVGPQSFVTIDAADGPMALQVSAQIGASNLLGLQQGLTLVDVGGGGDVPLGGSAFSDQIFGFKDGGDIVTGGGGGDLIVLGQFADGNVLNYSAASDSSPDAYDLVLNFRSSEHTPLDLIPVDRIDLSAVAPSAISVVRSDGVSFVFVDTPTGPMTIAVESDVNGTDFITGGSNHGGVYLIGDNSGDTLIGSTIGDPIQGGSGNDLITGGGGGDAIFGGGGANTFFYTHYSDSTQAAPDGIFDFKTGVDVVNLAFLAPTAVSLIRSGGSTFLFADGAGGHLQVNFVGHDVNGSDLVTFSNPGIYLIGDNSGDTLIGSAFGDPIQGGSGNDLIIGGGAGDALFGGGGINTFKYLAASDSTATASDSIFDFKAGIDKIDLSAVRESSTDVFGILSQSGSSFLFVKLDPGQADEHDMTIILNGTPSISANDIIWGAAPVHDITAVASSHIGESMPTAKVTGSDDGSVTHSLLDSGGHLTVADIMPPPSHLADPFEHDLLGPLGQHVAMLTA